MDYESLPEGFWQVNDKKFIKKFEALKYASQVKSQVKFIFFDHVWNSFNKESLGSQSLNDLYRIRAQQLRDEYDYLILYFSGGADSYNVMRSFIDNGIKLDEVCVKWPMVTVKSGIYTPNTDDLSSRNTLSEWDYAIKPILEWLSQNHPEIKINVVDWTEDFSDKLYSEELFHGVNNYNDVEIPFMMSYSESEKYYVERGKKVASIYGIDKPMVAYKDGKWFMGFLDLSTSMGTPSLVNPYGTEYFYWSPKLPELAFEQAHKLCEYLDKNPALKKYFLSEDSQTWQVQERLLNRGERNKISNAVIYDNWDNRFQANKPEIPDRADKHFWIFEHPELTRIRDHYIDMNSLMLSQVDDIFTVNVQPSQNNFRKKRGIFLKIYSKWHYVKKEEIYRY